MYLNDLIHFLAPASLLRAGFLCFISLWIKCLLDLRLLALGKLSLALSSGTQPILLYCHTPTDPSDELKYSVMCSFEWILIQMLFNRLIYVYVYIVAYYFHTIKSIKLQCSGLVKYSYHFNHVPSTY